MIVAHLRRREKFLTEIHDGALSFPRKTSVAPGIHQFKTQTRRAGSRTKVNTNRSGRIISMNFPPSQISPLTSSDRRQPRQRPPGRASISMWLAGNSLQPHQFFHHLRRRPRLENQFTRRGECARHQQRGGRLYFRSSCYLPFAATFCAMRIFTSFRTNVSGSGWSAGKRIVPLLVSYFLSSCFCTSPPATHPGKMSSAFSRHQKRPASGR